MRTETRKERMVEQQGAGGGSDQAVAANARGMSAPGSSVDKPSRAIRLLVIAVISVGGLAWDLWTKHQVFAALGSRGVHHVWTGQILGVAVQFQLETTFNHGALWGMGQGHSWLFATLSFFAIGAMCYFMWTGQATASKWLTVVCGLLLAGTLGNLFDRLGLHGWKDANGQAVHAVRDFLDFWFFGTFHWATFNFADTYLVTGAIMLVIYSFFLVPADQTETDPPRDT